MFKTEVIEILDTDKSNTAFISYQKKRLAERFLEKISDDDCNYDLITEGKADEVFLLLKSLYEVA